MSEQEGSCDGVLEKVAEKRRSQDRWKMEGGRVGGEGGMVDGGLE